MSVSHYTRRRILELLGPEELPPDRVVVIPNCVAAEHYADARELEKYYNGEMRGDDEAEDRGEEDVEYGEEEEARKAEKEAREGKGGDEEDEEEEEEKVGEGKDTEEGDKEDLMRKATRELALGPEFAARMFKVQTMSVNPQVFKKYITPSMLQEAEKLLPDPVFLPEGQAYASSEKGDEPVTLLKLWWDRIQRVEAADQDQDLKDAIHLIRFMGETTETLSDLLVVRQSFKDVSKLQKNNKKTREVLRAASRRVQRFWPPMPIPETPIPETPIPETP